MKASIIPLHLASPRPRRSRWLDRLAKRGVMDRLTQLQHGSLTLYEGDHQYHFGDTQAELKVSVSVKHPEFYSDLAFGGSIGAGEAYMRGSWQCSDLTRLVRLLLLNREVLDGMDDSLSRLRAPLYKAFHWLNRNTRQGSRQNIQAHYDLGNDFFRLFLDESMMYSCAIYENYDSSLAQASYAKLDRICQKLQLRPDDHVLEIGTGWGGFAIHAARHYGCRVTTTTLSREQYEYARARIEKLGLENRITLLLQDYRDLQGQYDKLVSIEMIEAIGHQYQNTYFAKCSDLLKPDGLMLLQAITIADQRYQAALRSVDFIQRYIFPGSFIPAISSMAASIARSGDMKITHLEDIGPHYARTLADWRTRFFDNLDQVKALGYPESFIRMWEFYLCYCEGGFIERAIGDVQILLSKPGARHNAVLGCLKEN
ncbi:MAG: cyclopropane-fatty-acyl-phospholipid synthase family protein [Thiohalophilus sp.]|uniref:cyclopropane-fatty-acyl-phospholipid synthase family protein n=1 Tax=Thiohalophilus sp. TaxID=3028392 RepID=UPI00287034F8|nr:cyclopropane-fatty-acyl-phospholipid synthase family protein [Thiohalophilus sp.]MDR9435940.1 cyclopropane-fatty-acyl-phospholipid synthase family protein [Thiohalophilus sp.]